MEKGGTTKINGRIGVSKFIVVPMALPKIGEKSHGYVNEAIIDGEIGAGKFVKRFEDYWANLNGYKFGISCNSGTNALHLAMKAVVAHKILLPNFTMSGTAYPAYYERCDITYYPTRADLPLPEWDIPNIENFDTIVFAHIYGRKAYPEGAIKKLKARNPALVVIDDMAEAHGVNAEGDIACYSFYANKIITTGEGGMCLTNNQIIADEMRSLANMYFDKERSMIHPKIGHNYRMTNLQAAIGLGQAEDFEKIISKREKITKWYDKYLPERMKIGDREVLWYYDCKVKNAKQFQYFLEKQGVASRRFFYPMSLQPWGNQMPDPNALNWYKHGLLLPTYLDLNESDVKWVCQTILDIEKRLN